jgi:hypothetical protein
MSGLNAVEHAFQRYVLDGDRRVHELVAPGPRDNAERRLAIYYNAYRQRLVEALSTDFEALAAVLGTDRFRAMCLHYVEHTPSQFRNIRWYGGALPDFLASTHPWRLQPELAEIARFEWTLTLAFDAPEAKAMSFDDLAALPPDAWSTLRVELDPSLHLLALRSNAPALRMATDAEAALPPVQLSSEPVDWAVWRKAGAPHFRSLQPEEACAVQAVRRGEGFAALCEGLIEFGRAEEAPALAAGMLRHWVDDELIVGVSASAT